MSHCTSKEDLMPLLLHFYWFRQLQQPLSSFVLQRSLLQSFMAIRCFVFFWQKSEEDWEYFLLFLSTSKPFPAFFPRVHLIDWSKEPLHYLKIKQWKKGGKRERTCLEGHLVLWTFATFHLAPPPPCTICVFFVSAPKYKHFEAYLVFPTRFPEHR